MNIVKPLVEWNDLLAIEYREKKERIITNIQDKIYPLIPAKITNYEFGGKRFLHSNLNEFGL